MVPNSEGTNTMPSYVAFDHHDILVGQAAKNQVIKNPKNTIYDVKRLVGRRMDDPTIKLLTKNQLLSYEFIGNSAGFPKIYVNEGKVDYEPEEINALILSQLKKDAEKFAGCKITDVVITVPVRFNFTQRDSVRMSGKLAGFNVLGIVNEPTAAALAYGFDANTTDFKNIMIYDLVGGTFDVTVLTIGEGIVRVVKTGGNELLGGEDFTHSLMEYCLKMIKVGDKNYLVADKRSRQRLRAECEAAKRALSQREQYTIELSNLYENQDFTCKIQRYKFNAINNEPFTETISTVRQVLKDAAMRPSEIDKVIMVGGSTRIPKIVEELKGIFGIEKIIDNSIHPDEAVAKGAAIRAAMLATNSRKESIIEPWKFFDRIYIRDYKGCEETLIEADIPLVASGSTTNSRPRKFEQTSDF